MNTKDTNPKDAVGTAKPPISVVPQTVMAEVGVAMMEGARKYRRHNYRVIGVRASIYIDACFRHLAKWWEGEDIDADSGLSHVTKAIATLVVLRDAMIQSKLNDDRPPKAPAGFFKDLEEQCKVVIAKYPESLPAYTEIGQEIGQVPDSEIVLKEEPISTKYCVCGAVLANGICPVAVHRKFRLAMQDDVIKVSVPHKRRFQCETCGTAGDDLSEHRCPPFARIVEQRMCAHFAKFLSNDDFCVRCGNCNHCCTEL